MAEGLLPPDPKTAWLRRRFRLEYGLVISFFLVFGGIGLFVWALLVWSKTGFGPLAFERSLRIVISASTLLALGVQLGFISFFMSVLELGKKPRV